MIYYIFEDDYYLIFENNKKSLPIDGWFQQCIFCSEVTGTSKPFSHKTIKVKVMCCKSCNNKVNQEKYTKKIDSWIYTNISQSHRRKLTCKIF